jgi:hypothetical protein
VLQSANFFLQLSLDMFWHVRGEMLLCRIRLGL